MKTVLPFNAWIEEKDENEVGGVGIDVAGNAC
jgi:hypothetical protein